MPLAPVRLADHAHVRLPPKARDPAGSGARGHAHPPGHDHDHAAPSHPHHAHHHHAHAAGERHPPARPAFSLLRLSAPQRLAIALPLAALLWAMALAVIGAGV